MSMKIDPAVVARAKEDGCSIRVARLRIRGLRQAGRGPGMPRRVTPPALRKALSKFYGASAKAITPAERTEIGEGFSMGQRTVGRHLEDLKNEYATERDKT